MPLSPKAKAHKHEYDTSRFKTISVSLPKETAEKFHEFCALQGLTAHTLLKNYISKCLDADGTGG